MTLESEMFENKPPSPRKHNRKPEAKVQKAIIAWLLEHRVVLAVTDAGALARHFGISCGIPRGWPDITGCVRGGRFIGVECKAPGGRQSKDQQAVERSIRGNGGHYCLAQSVADVENYFRDHLLLLDIV